MAEAEAAAEAVMVVKVAAEAMMVVEDAVVGSVIVLIVSVQTTEEQAVMVVLEVKEAEERDITGMETMPLLIFKLQVVEMVLAVLEAKEAVVEAEAQEALAVAEAKVADLNQMVKAEAKVAQEIRVLQTERVADTIPLVVLVKQAKVAEALAVIMVKLAVAVVYLISNLNRKLIQS